MTALILIGAPLLLIIAVVRECGRVLTAIDETNQRQREREAKWLHDQIDVGGASDFIQHREAE